MGGFSQEKRVRIFDFDGHHLREIKSVDNNRGQITSLSFSPDGSMLASADRERCILVFDCADWTVIMTTPVSIS